MGIVEGDHGVEKILQALQQNLREHMVLFAVILVIVCAAVVLLAVYLGRKKKNGAGKKREAVAQNTEMAEKAEEITLDLTEHTEELKAYADEVRTLVDIGYFSQTEVIE